MRYLIPLPILLLSGCITITQQDSNRPIELTIHLELPANAHSEPPVYAKPTPLPVSKREPKVIVKTVTVKTKCDIIDTVIDETDIDLNQYKALERKNDLIRDLLNKLSIIKASLITIKKECFK